jgi:hypothetical protein
MVYAHHNRQNCVVSSTHTSMCIFARLCPRTFYGCGHVLSTRVRVHIRGRVCVKVLIHAPEWERPLA